MSKADHLCSVKKDNIIDINNCLHMRFSINIGKAIIPYGETKIEAKAFQGRTDLIRIEIPDSVTEIDDNAFFDCSGLISIEIPTSVTRIGCYAFYGCSNLAAKVP